MFCASPIVALGQARFMFLQGQPRQRGVGLERNVLVLAGCDASLRSA